MEGDIFYTRVQIVNGLFLSTPSGWRATISFADRLGKIDISIHALRVEGDSPGYAPHFSDVISIHALRVEGDSPKCTKNQTRHCISIHALRVEGDYLPPFIPIVYHISIHALRVEGDAGVHSGTTFVSIFLSTPSGWRATQCVKRPTICSLYFYPRPPGGGRHTTFPAKGAYALFLSTPSGWRATLYLFYRVFR